MDLDLKQKEEATTKASETSIADDDPQGRRPCSQAHIKERQALLRALSRRLLLQTDTRTRDADVFEKGRVALPDFYTLVAGTTVSYTHLTLPTIYSV